MEQRTTELGLSKIFRGYCGFVVVYFMAFFAYTALVIGEVFSATLILFYINLGTFAVLFGYLSWVWLEKRLGKFYFPIAILIATLVPMYSVSIFWPFEMNDAVSDIVFRSWYLIPVLIVPITMLAWQYGYRVALLYVLVSSFYDLPFIVMRIEEINLETIQLLGVPILRTIAFGTVGVIVGLLMSTQRAQRRKLVQANIQLGRYADTLEELATSRERNRLARELHDTLAHTLSSQILTLEALRLSTAPENERLHSVLSDLIENSRIGLTETRRALKDLRSKQLDDLGLRTSLECLLADAASRANCEIKTDIQGDIAPIPKEIEQCIYRIATEGLENIVRHSDATAIKLSLRGDNDILRFSLEDDGIGFSPSTSGEIESHGVRGMRERAQGAGGVFSISSKNGKGTKIEVRFEVKHDPRFIM